ncbi:S-phase kinase-associated protein 1-like [Oppia nitens]|uniref:S-phase kinase-associated protein 1-like n=1 Tax=Oppia nitens TaxID=1686743 RepID=UPI0023DCD6CD|nr:S-phase kinase-associated protein 1-like [Oppia nitens]
MASASGETIDDSLAQLEANEERMAKENKIKIKLKSNEGGVVECGLTAAKMSVLVKNMLETIVDPQKPLEELANQEPTPLNNEAVTDAALKKIVEWCEYHWDDPPIDEDFEEEKDRRNEELSHWDKQFIDIPDQGDLFDIIAAANFLDIKGLVEVGAKHICSKIKGKTCAEVRDMLKITNDFTPEEEEAIHKENEWIYAKD